MSLARRRTKGLLAVLVGSTALMMVGTAVADRERPERKLGSGDAASKLADPSAQALKKQADEARDLARKVDAMVENVDKSVQDLESITDNIQNKGDKSALGQADGKLNQLKSSLKSLDEQTNELNALATRMDREITRLKSGGPAGREGGAPPPRRR